MRNWAFTAILMAGLVGNSTRAEATDVYRLVAGNVSGGAGDRLRVPVLLRNSKEVFSMSFGLLHTSGVVRLHSIELCQATLGAVSFVPAVMDSGGTVEINLGANPIPPEINPLDDPLPNPVAVFEYEVLNLSASNVPLEFSGGLGVPLSVGTAQGTVTPQTSSGFVQIQVAPPPDPDNSLYVLEADSSPSNVRVGERFTVDVCFLNNGSCLSAAFSSLIYDTAILAVTDLEVGSPLPGNENDIFECSGTIYNEYDLCSASGGCGSFGFNGCWYTATFEVFAFPPSGQVVLDLSAGMWETDSGRLVEVPAVDAIVEVSSPATPFRRGDINGDTVFNLVDAIMDLTHQFQMGPTMCVKAHDFNDDGSLNLADSIMNLSFLFVPGSPPPAAPHPGCGMDPTPDALDCVGPVFCP